MHKNLFACLFIAAVSAVSVHVAADDHCTEGNDLQGHPDYLAITAYEYWKYALYVSKCEHRYYMQVDYVEDHALHTMAFELNPDELTSLADQGGQYLLLLFKVARFNHVEFEQERHINDFSAWPSVREANERYVAELFE